MLPDPKDPAFVGALVYFNKAAERLSFADAASELGVTPSAVSHRVAALEAALGKRLFERETRRIRLTRDGAELANVTQSVWSELHRITENVASRKVLRVSVGPYLSSTWLMPQLCTFEHQHTDVRVDLAHIVGPSGPRSVDVAITWADIDPPQPNTTRLFDTFCLPVTAPGTHNNHPFWENALLPIHYRDRKPWRHWLLATGGPVEFAELGEILDDPNLVFEAAAHKRGIAIGFLPFVDTMIRQGRLVAACEKTVPAERGYWITVTDRNNDLSVQFEKWVIGAAREMTALPA